MLQKNISRRVFIGASVYLVTVPLFASVLNSTTQLLEISSEGSFFNADELTILTDIAEIMIPHTSTPGATDAHVVPVLDGLMITWAGSKTKVQFRSVLEQISLFANEVHQQGYLALDLKNRVALITELDKTAFKNKKTDLSESYRKLKKMIFHVYYTSEQANPNFVLIPGGYRGNLSKSELDQIQQRGYL